jgi:glutamate synthase (NADPH/NADH) large chain/glutamate synthase (ferredoxin)
MDTCPVGIATQNPELRKKFTGDAEHVANFMRFVATETRELMAELGFRTINEMVGRTDALEVNEAIDHWKAKDIDLSALLYSPDLPAKVGRYHTVDQDHDLEKTLDFQELIPICRKAIENQQPVEFTTAIRNINRVTATMLGSEITRRYGEKGLPEDTIRLTLKGSAGQSFGAFIPRGITLRLVGDSNDFVGKGLSGGKIIVHPDPVVTFPPEKNIIIGNVAFYGASAGEAYIQGIAGERFCVRNSGANVVVEGVGDHGCEYMTGGKVVVLGSTGRNFAAGMSGGVAYVFDEDETFLSNCNTELVQIQPVEDNEEMKELYSMIEKHVDYTNSGLGKRILAYWEKYSSQFVRVIPKSYLTINNRIKELQDTGLTIFDAQMTAFEESKKVGSAK